MNQALEEYLDRVLAYAKRNEIDSQKIKAELKDHLLKKIEELESEGAKHEDAVFQAIQGHGHPKTVGYSLQNIRSIRRRIGAIAAFILMLMLLFPLIWFTHTTSTYARLASPRFLIIGQAFMYRWEDPPPDFEGPDFAIGYGYSLTTIFLALALPCTILARYFSHRKTRLAYWSFAIPTAVLYVWLLIILTIPFSWLIQLIDRAGFTPGRRYCLYYGLGGYILILTFLYWVLRRPKAYKKPSSGQE